MMVVIREANGADARLLVTMIRELAEFEGQLANVEITAEDLLRDGFQEASPFRALIAEHDGHAAGYAFYFFTYSTWAGRCSLFVEDIYVRAEFRRKGVGKGLLKHMAKIALEKSCYGMRWEVLNWNTSAIEFYRSLGVELQRDWFPVLLRGESFERLARH